MKKKTKLPKQPKLDPVVKEEFMQARRDMLVSIKKRLEKMPKKTGEDAR